MRVLYKCNRNTADQQQASCRVFSMSAMIASRLSRRRALSRRVIASLRFGGARRWPDRDGVRLYARRAICRVNPSDFYDFYEQEGVPERPL